MTATTHQPIRLLLVEDSPGEARLIREMLAAVRGDSFEVEHADRLAPALERLARGGVDVLLLDLRLPDTDGLETFTRARAEAPDVAIVILTGMDDEELAVTAVRQGAQDYLLKGQVDSPQLALAVRCAIERKQGQEALKLRARQQSAVAELSQQALRSSDSLALMQEAAVLVGDTLGLEYCRVLELLPSGEAMVVRASRGWTNGSGGGATVSVGPDSQDGYTLLSNGPVIVDDTRTETRFSAAPLLLEHDVTSGMSVVVSGRARPFGVLAAHARRRRTFTDEDVHFLQSIANVLGIAIERGRAEERTQQVAAQLAHAQQLTHIGSWEWILSTGAAIWSEELCHIYGVIPDEIGRALETYLQYVHPEDREFTRRTLEGGLRAHTMFSFDHRIVRADGTPRILHAEGGVVLDHTGVPVRMIGTAQDITERRRVEDALHETQERFRSAFEHSGTGMALQGLDGRYVRVNHALCEMLGYSEDELLAATCEETPPDESAVPRENERRMLAGALSYYEREQRYTHKQGHVVTARVSVSLVRDAVGRPMNVLLQFQDLTQHRVLEQQLRQAQKMEAIGRLAGGVAHDFNNMLTVIAGRTEMMLARLGAGHALRENLQLIRTTAARASRLTQQLLAFSRRQILHPSVLDLNAVAHGLREMLSRLLGEDVELVTLLPPPAKTVRADLTQVEQILVNLAVNARDAMPRGGRLTIATATVELDEVFAGDHPGARPGRYGMISVSDTGLGMGPEVQAQLFEPFFTTKDVGRGTGLGLATVYGIVKQHAGHIAFKSELGRGSTFYIYLPHVDAPLEAPLATSLPAAPRGGRERIMLVEDEDSLRDLARDILEAEGYTVIEARNASEALLVAENYSADIDLLVTDVIMPQMSGRELAERLTRSRPMRVLYMSGYTENAIVHPGGSEANVPFLAKPFLPDALLDKVREVLDTPSART